MTDIVAELREAIGAEKVLSSPVDLIAYSFDGTFEQHMPEVVVLPETNEEVAAVIKVATQHEVPIVPRGMSSGLAGGSIPFGGGIVLSLTRMNRILEIDEENMIVTVQAGMVTADLQAEVEKLGLFYPPDPSSNRQSTIGGNIACDAGGPRCLKYGVAGDYVMGLTVVFGHASDGNLHPNSLFDRRDPEQWEKVQQIVGEVFQVALELGGTLSGEHGVGTFKLPYMEQALAPTSIDVQRRVKKAFDPQNILSPGKVLPNN